MPAKQDYYKTLGVEQSQMRMRFARPIAVWRANIIPI